MNQDLKNKLVALRIEAETDMVYYRMTIQIQMSHTMKDDMLNPKHITKASWIHSI